jgi:hypothetical protein
MTRLAQRVAVLVSASSTFLLGFQATAAADCPLIGGCPDVNFGQGEIFTNLDGAFVTPLVAKSMEVPAYEWRMRSLCEISQGIDGTCSPSDFRPCDQPSERVVRYLVLERRALVQEDGEVADDLVAPPGAPAGTPVGPWVEEIQGCFDITQLNPPPSPAEVFSYFERLPLPELEARHQPPGSGLSGLPVIFYTDEGTTETFTVDIRGFDVIINAGATSFTWNTGDPADPTITTDHPGAPYPDHAITHDYTSGTYTASLTVTWGATFTVDGSAPANVPGTTTTQGSPVTFDVLQARPVLVHPN